MLPSGLHKVPARLGLLHDVGSLRRGCDFEEVIGKNQAFGAARKVHFEKRRGYLTRIDNMESVEDVTKAILYRNRRKLVERDSARIEAQTCVEKLVRAAGTLPGRDLGMFADMLGERDGELVKRDGVASLLSKLHERLRKGELVRGCVLAEKNDAAPAGLRERTRAQIFVD